MSELILREWPKFNRLHAPNFRMITRVKIKGHKNIFQPTTSQTTWLLASHSELPYRAVYKKDWCNTAGRKDPCSSYKIRPANTSLHAWIFHVVLLSNAYMQYILTHGLFTWFFPTTTQVRDISQYKQKNYTPNDHERELNLVSIVVQKNS